MNNNSSPQTPNGKHPQYRALIPVAILITLGLIWGGTTSLSKAVSLRGVPALGYALWVSIGAGVLLLMACFVMRKPVPLTREYLRYYLLCGLLGSALPTTNMFYVLQEIPAGVMSMALATVSMLTYLFALALRLEHFVLKRAFGIGLGLLGALLILAPTGLGGFELKVLLGLSFLTPALYATNTIYAERHRPQDADAMVLAAGMMCGSAAALAVPAAITGSFYPLHLHLTTALIVGHALAATFAFFLYFYLLKLSGPVYLSQVSYVVTIAGVGFGILVFGETHGPTTWLALALIFAGLTLVNAKRAR